MRGHVTRRGDAWRVHVFVGRDVETGKQRYVTRTVRGTKREAQNVCAALVAEAARGGFGDTESGTFEDLLWRWLEHIEPRIAPSTRAGYGVYLRRWIIPALGSKRVDRITAADIDRFYARLRKPLSAASVLRVHNIIRASLGQAVKWGMLADNPALRTTPPRATRPPIRPPSPEEVAKLIAAADAEEPEFGLFVRVAAVTGARRGELCALRWTDIDLDTGEIVIARSLSLGDDGMVEKSTKTNRARRIALDGGTANALDAHHAMCEERAAVCGAALLHDGFVFSRDVVGELPWRPDSGVTYRFERLRKKVGLDTVRFHDLRHYVATRLLDAGLPVRAVSERLGHASATTTLTIYAHAVPATDQRAAEIMGNLLEPQLDLPARQRSRR